MNEENQPQNFSIPQSQPSPQNPPQPQSLEKEPDQSTEKITHVTETPQKAIRTYESDVADVLAHKNISTANIAMAEQKKASGIERLGNVNDIESAETNTATNSHPIKKTIIALLSLILIGGGAGAAYYFYSMSPLAGAPAIQQTSQKPTSLVPADSQVIIPIDNLTTLNIINLVKNEINKPQEPNTIKELIFVKNVNSQRSRVSGPEMIKIMDINVPDIITRSLGNDWMFGVYADQTGEKRFFIVSSISYFQNTFAGMLQWESVMPDDLKLYFSNSTSIVKAPVEAELIGTSTATSTASSSLTSIASSTASTANKYVSNDSYTTLRGSFTDRIVGNRDVREFVTANGHLFLYSFIDDSKLVFTGSESTLSALLDRLEQKAYIR